MSILKFSKFNESYMFYHFVIMQLNRNINSVLLACLILILFMWQIFFIYFNWWKSIICSVMNKNSLLTGRKYWLRDASGFRQIYTSWEILSSIWQIFKNVCTSLLECDTNIIWRTINRNLIRLLIRLDLDTKLPVRF